MRNVIEICYLGAEQSKNLIRYFSVKDGVHDEPRLGSDEWVARLNRFYEYTWSYKSIDDCPENYLQFTSEYLVVGGSVQNISALYRHFTYVQMRQIGELHGIDVVRKVSAVDMKRKLQDHECTGCCNRECVHVFKTRTQERSKQRRVVPVGTHFPVEDVVDESDGDSDDNGSEVIDGGIDDSPFDLPDDALKESIVRDWQNMMNTERRRLTVCAVCSKRVEISNTTQRQAASSTSLSSCENRLSIFSALYPRK